MYLLKFQSGELIGCEIEFHIQVVPTQHTFLWTPLPQKQEIPEKCDDDVIIMFFRYFLFLGEQGTSKVC